MRITIDRIEGKFAVCELEDGTFAEISCVILGDVNEGDVFDIEITKNESVAKTKKQYAQSLFDKLKKN